MTANVSPAALQELVLLGQIAFVLAITLLIGSWMAVAARLWVRFRVTKSPGRDDAAMVATLLLFTVYCVLIVVLIVRQNSGAAFSPDNVKITLIYVQLSEVFYVLTTTLLKISLGLFFLRVLSKKWQRILFHSILAISVIFGLLYFFVSIFQCGDPAKLVEIFEGSKQCLPRAFLLGSGYMYGTINVIADWTFVLVPITVLLDSEMDRRSKVSVSIVMGLGAVGSVSSIVRMVYLEGLEISSVGVDSASVKATIWATAEPGTGIIAASVAIMRPLVRKIASGTRERVSEYRKTRKASLPMSIRKIDSVDRDSIIALTEVVTKDNQDSNNGNFKNDTSWYLPHEEDVWSPTAIIGRASLQSITTVQMNKSKPLPKAPPPGFF